ncbi:MAG: EF-hand domain-containing protein [Burkholderiales bacterium]
MKAFLTIILSLAACAAFAQAPAEYLKRVTDSYRTAFSAYERNGVVARAAVQGDLFFGPRFDAIDINRDGVITREELDRFLANLPASAA